MVLSLSPWQPSHIQGSRSASLFLTKRIHSHKLANSNTFVVYIYSIIYVRFWTSLLACFPNVLHMKLVFSVFRGTLPACMICCNLWFIWRLLSSAECLKKELFMLTACLCFCLVPIFLNPVSEDWEIVCFNVAVRLTHSDIIVFQRLQKLWQ